MASPWLDELNLGIPATHDMLPGLLPRVLEKAGTRFWWLLGMYLVVRSARGRLARPRNDSFRELPYRPTQRRDASGKRGDAAFK